MRVTLPLRPGRRVAEAAVEPVSQRLIGSILWNQSGGETCAVLQLYSRLLAPKGS